MTHVRDVFQSKYIGKDDVKEPATVTIHDDETTVFRDGKTGWLIYFEEFEKPLSLNKTNAEALAAAFGPDSNGWIGKKVELYVDPNVTNPSGQRVGGIRIRPIHKESKPEGQELAEKEFADSDIPF